jgi:hypothetical protein
MAGLMDNMRYVLQEQPGDVRNDTLRIVLKELLQSYTLDFIYNHNQYRLLNFYGGTCLHVVYGLNRLSEDIDLDNRAGIPLNNLENDLLDFFNNKIGYSGLSTKTLVGSQGIHRLALRFPVLYALGLSEHENEGLHLKIEISPQVQIANMQKTPVFLFGRSFVASHFTLETMMAGKMIACLERNFQHGKSGVLIKGRDFYDLLWFMQQGIMPLEEKLAKDGLESYSTISAMELLVTKTKTIKRRDLALDLIPLFKESSYIQIWLDHFQENFIRFSMRYL